MLFLALFILIPIVELYTMLAVSHEIGALSTVSLVLLTAIIGGFLVRFQGLSVLMRSQAMLARGEQPAIEMFEGVVLLICGFMLLLPGFISDTLGFLLLIPPLRRKIIWTFLKKVQVKPANDVFYEEPKTQGTIIDGTFKRED